MKLSIQEHLDLINNKSCMSLSWCLMNNKNECKIHAFTEEDLLLDKHKYLLKTGIYYIFKVEHYYSIDKLIDTGKTIIVL